MCQVLYSHHGYPMNTSPKVPVSGWTFEWWETGNEQIKNQFAEVWWWWMLWRKEPKKVRGWREGEGFSVSSFHQRRPHCENCIWGSAHVAEEEGTHISGKTGQSLLGGRGNSKLARVTGHNFKQEKLDQESFKKLARCWLLFLSKTEATEETDSFDFISNRVTLAAIRLQYTE